MTTSNSLCGKTDEEAVENPETMIGKQKNLSRRVKRQDKCMLC